MKNAQEKLRTNIAEYLLYMWQLEDIIRSFNFDIEAIEFNLIRHNYKTEKEITEAKAWYEGLIRKMREDKLEQKGHHHELSELMAELFYLHNTLLNITKDEKYIQLHEDATVNIQEFRAKSNTKSMNEVELCLNGLYSKLLLRLKKTEISAETELAFETFRKMIAYLSTQYHKMKRGEMNFHYN